MVGTTSAALCLAAAAALARPALLLAAPLVGYGCAWVGHAAFERNRPATFRYPLWSLAADCLMLAEVASGRRAF